MLQALRLIYLNAYIHFDFDVKIMEKKHYKVRKQAQISRIGSTVIAALPP